MTRSSPAPDKSERQSLASYTASPNLDEHFKMAVLLFTGETYRDLMAQIRENPFNKKSPEMGLTMAPEWASVTRNLAASFECRLVLDLLSGDRASPSQAFFFAAIGGGQLGNFDVIYGIFGGLNRSRSGKSVIATIASSSMCGRRLNRDRSETGCAPRLRLSSS